MMCLELHADVVVVVGRFRYSCRMPKYEKSLKIRYTLLEFWLELFPGDIRAGIRIVQKSYCVM